jgi:hypothetical protein
LKKQQIRAGAASLLIGVLAPVALLVPSVSAASITWTGIENSVYGNVDNWVGGVVPGSSDSAVFPTSSLRQLITVTSPKTLDKIIFSGARSGPSSKDFVISSTGLITIKSGIEAIMTGTGGNHLVDRSMTLSDNATFKTSGVDTLQVGEDGTTLSLGDKNLTLEANGGTITLAGQIAGSGKIIVNGTGNINMLASAATGYTGSVEITKGTFSATDGTQGNILVNGGTLKGSSVLLGTVTMSSGTITPGFSPGCLGTKDLTFTGGKYIVEIEGVDKCTGYDQITVEGKVDLGTGTTLEVQRLSSYKPEVNKTFTIILNDGTDAVVGNFKDLKNGDKFTVDGYTYRIHYDAGDGNDVVLIVTGTPSAPDTGVGSMLTSPLMALAAVFATLSVIGGLKFAEQRRK